MRFVRYVYKDIRLSDYSRGGKGITRFYYIHVYIYKHICLGGVDRPTVPSFFRDRRCHGLVFFVEMSLLPWASVIQEDRDRDGDSVFSCGSRERKGFFL